MKSTSKLIIIALTFLTLAASTFAQEPSAQVQSAAAVKKAEAALAQAKSAEATAKALDDKEALSISQQAVAIAEKSLARAQKAADASVVNAQNVPSGLPKALDNAIAGGYADAPPGVSDRVRKGFQAVMERDWKVAKAWFEDALNRDPNNAGLKRLVALASYSQQPKPQPAVSEKPFTNEPIPPNADKRTYAETSMKIHSQEEWRKFLFPGESSAPATKPSRTPIYMLGRDGKPLELPDDYKGEVQTYAMGKDGNLVTLPKSSDGLFETTKAVTPVPRAISDATYRKDKAGNLIEVPEDYDGEETTYKIGTDNNLMIMPKPSDVLFLFPGPTK